MLRGLKQLTLLILLISCSRENDLLKSSTNFDEDTETTCSGGIITAYANESTKSFPNGKVGDTHTVTCEDDYLGGGAWTCTEGGSWSGYGCILHLSQEYGDIKDGTESGEYMLESYAKENVSCDGEQVDFPDHSLVLKFDLTVNSTIILPAYTDKNFYVDWGDDSCEHKKISHTYSADFIDSLEDGLVTIKVIGTVERWDNNPTVNYTETLKEVVNLGDLGWLRLYEAFQDAEILTSFNSGHTNTSEVTTLYGMFRDTVSLVNTDFKNFDTSKVNSMASLFIGASSLEKLDLSTFNTQNVTTMQSMFSGTTNLKELNLSNFNTSKVTSMRWMFQSMREIVTLDLRSFDTSKVMSMEGMFRQTWKLENIYLENFNTENVYTMNGLFEGAKALKEVNLDSFNTSNVITMTKMFSGAESLEAVDVSKFNTSKVLDMSFMFNDTTSLKRLDLSNFDTSMTANMNYMLKSSHNLEHINFGAWEESTYLEATTFSDWPSPPTIYCDSAPTGLSCDETPPMILKFTTTSDNEDVSLGISGGAVNVIWGDSSTDNRTSHQYGDQGTYEVWVSGVDTITTLNDSWSDNLVSVNTLGDLSSLATITSPFEGHTGIKSISGFAKMPVPITSLDSLLKDTTSLEFVDITNMEIDSITNVNNFLSGASSLKYVNLGDKFDDATNKDDVLTSTPIELDNSNSILYCTKQYDETLDSTNLPKNWTIELNGGTYACHNTLIPVVLEITPSTTTTFTLNFSGTPSITDWGDGSDLEYNSKNKDYVDTNTKVIKVWGNYYAGLFNNDSKDKINKVTSFGHKVFTNSTTVFRRSSLQSASGYGKFGPVSQNNMFYECSLSSADFSNFYTDEVTDMSFMFKGLTALTQLDLSNFKTENVTSMQEMFTNSNNLETLDISNFNTKNVTNMSGMFSYTSSLESLDVTHFDTSNVENFDMMFEGQETLTSIDLSSFDTSKGVDFNYMFYYSTGITSLDVSNFDTSKAVEMVGFLEGTSNLTNLNIGYIEKNKDPALDDFFKDSSFLSGNNNTGLTCLNKDDTSNPDNFVINADGELFSCGGN